MGRNHLAGSAGDAINPILAAVGYNFRRLLAWLGLLFALLRILFTRNTRIDQAVAPT